MPWNDQSGGGDNRGRGGPWGGGPRQPWGQGPNKPQQNQNGGDLEDMLRRARERFGRFGGGNGRNGGRPRQINFGAVAGVIAALWLATGVYIVDEGEEGVVTRLGAYAYSSTPGLHWHLPIPFENVRVISVSSQRRVEVGLRRGQDVEGESLMITGDRNIVDMDFAVVYRLKDARAFLFNVADPEEAVRGVAESAMREVVGQRELEAIITTDRGAVEQAVATQLQQVLDSYNAGVDIVGVQLLKTAPPPDVQEAFNEVVRAGSEAESTINQATTYANQVVPRARGEAAQIVQAAEAYREQAVREANGEAERFALIEQQYRSAPRVTRDRLYLETMERIYGGAETIIIDRNAGAVPVLPLDQLRRSPPAATAPGAR